MLEADGIDAIELDVNSDESITNACNLVMRETGLLDVLVDDAGCSQVGALIDLTREDLRRQYERMSSPQVQ